MANKAYSQYLILVLTLIFVNINYADTVARYFDYSSGDTVTDVNLDGNFNNIVNELNGGLTNDNADTANGFRFIQILGTLPAAGNQGRVVFQQSDNSLYFDTGSAWRQVVTPSGSAVQGDIVYFGGTTWDLLAKNATSTRYLSNTGGSNNPAWAQVNLANGITIASQATGDILYASSSSAWTRLGVGSNGQVLKLASGLPSWASGSNVELFTANGTFTTNANTTIVYITMCGSGGGGEGGNGGSTNGGGGGAECIVNYPYTVSASTAYDVVIGAAGAGGVGNNPGTNGAASTFDTTLSAAGGTGGGSAVAGDGGIGGANTATSWISFSASISTATVGETGGNGRGIPGGNGGRGGASNGGGGGGSLFGDGASGGTSGGAAGTGYGSGGAGAGNGSSGDGGTGTAGICIVMF